MKELFTIIAIILSIIAYVPYIYNSVRRDTIPHAFSWGIWGCISLCIFWLQRNDGAGIGSYVTLTTAITLLFIAAIGFKRGSDLITPFDTLILLTAVIAMALWYFIDNAQIAITILIAIEMIGFIPTFRKAWKLPNTETLSLFFITLVQYLCTIVALEAYSYVTLLNPLVWIIANICFISMVLLRRNGIKQSVLLPLSL